MKPGETVLVCGRVGQQLRPGTPLTIVEVLTRHDDGWGFGDYRLQTRAGRDVWLYRREVVAVDVRQVAA